MSLSALHRIAGIAPALAFACLTESPKARESDGGNAATVAVGAAMMPSYTGSDDYRIRPGVLVRARVNGHTIATRGTTVTVDAIAHSDRKATEWSLGPVAGVRFNRTGHIGDARVRALGKLDPAWEAGGWIGVTRRGLLTSRHDSLSLRVSALADVVGEAHRSYIVTPSIEYAMPLSLTTLLALSVSADYVGKGYGRYYFDVTAAGSQASGLPVYAGADKAGLMRVTGGVLAAQSLSGDLRRGWALFGGATYGRLLGRYAASPIVSQAGDRDQWLGGMGVAYSF